MSQHEGWKWENSFGSRKQQTDSVRVGEIDRKDRRDQYRSPKKNRWAWKVVGEE